MWLLKITSRKKKDGFHYTAVIRNSNDLRITVRIVKETKKMNYKKGKRKKSRDFPFLIPSAKNQLEIFIITIVIVMVLSVITSKVSIMIDPIT